MLKFEREALHKGYALVLGLDEAGRGPLAGPVVAGAVALTTFEFQSKVRDSKTLSAPQRERAFHEIMAKAYVGVGVMSEAVVDSHNILEATFLAMNNAVLQLLARLPVPLRAKVDQQSNIFLLVDGNRFKTDLPYPFRTLVKGDSRSLSVACASIIAKVTRDRILDTYDKVFPDYGFRQHKGYPTVAHKKAIKKHGLSIVHRKTFHFQ